MRVIDGMHRVRAAEMRGDTVISVRFFDGDEEDAFLLSVAVNMRHGLPLTRADRTAAVERILGLHPEWSDRALASFAGVSARRVADIRGGLRAGGAVLEARIGRDGRSRPVDGGRRREHAHALLLADPSASLRAVAREAGISPATVADVRARIRRGLDAVPAGGRGGSRRAPGVTSGRRRSPQGPPPSLAEVLALADRLRRDPAVRLSETGRTMLRMLDSCAAVAREKQRIIESLPAHCVDSAELIMHALADLCHSFGDELSQKRDSTTEEFAIGGTAAN
ncbi:transcriptional regulator [Streptomyces nodosus]